MDINDLNAFLFYEPHKLIQCGRKEDEKRREGPHRTRPKEDLPQIQFEGRKSPLCSLFPQEIGFTGLKEQHRITPIFEVPGEIAGDLANPAQFLVPGDHEQYRGRFFRVLVRHGRRIGRFSALFVLQWRGPFMGPGIYLCGDSVRS